MGKSILTTVIDLLSQGGVAAAPAQPERHMLNIQTAVAAVSIGKVDTAAGFVEVLVEVVGPMEGGAHRCQKRALTVCELLRGAGAECVQGKCTFEGRSALFCVPVTARFYGREQEETWIPRPVVTATLAGMPLEYMTAFSAEQVKGEEDASLYAAPWALILEEFFPAGTEEPLDPQEPFVLEHGQQVFSGCTWTARERIYSESGIRQVRKGIAAAKTAV